MKKILFYLLIIPTMVSGQSDKAVDALYSDFSVPDASAFTLLGIGSDKVTKPSSPKELAASIQNIASNGQKIPAFAIEWAPWQTFNRQKINDSVNLFKTWGQYYDSRFKRAFAISFASLQDSLGSKTALGMNICLMDKTDPAYNRDYVFRIALLSKITLTPSFDFAEIRDRYVKYRDSVFTKWNLNPFDKLLNDDEFNGVSTSALPDRGKLREQLKIKLGISLTDKKDKRITGIDDLLEIYFASLKSSKEKQINDKSSFEKIIADEKDNFKKEHWNDLVLKFGAGNIWNSSTNKWGQLKPQKFSSYVSFGFALWKSKDRKFSGQGILLLQGGQNYDDSDVNNRQFTGGGRVVMGSNKIHGSIELVYQADGYKKIGEITAKGTKETLRSTLGVEIRMSDGLWVELATGINGGPKDFFKNADMLGIASVKYTFKKESRFTIP